MSGYQPLIPSVDNQSENNLELPQLLPPPVKKLLFPLDAPPSPAPIARMSPKVAASLEKINHLLASNPPLQQANSVSNILVCIGCVCIVVSNRWFIFTAITYSVALIAMYSKIVVLS